MFVAKTVPVFGKELAHVMYTSYTEYENPLVVQDSIKYLIEGMLPSAPPLPRLTPFSPTR